MGFNKYRIYKGLNTSDRKLSTNTYPYCLTQGQAPQNWVGWGQILRLQPKTKMRRRRRTHNANRNHKVVIMPESESDEYLRILEYICNKYLQINGQN